MNAQYKEQLKLQLIKLVEEHKTNCYKPDCGISTYCMYELLKLADITVSQEELKYFL